MLNETDKRKFEKLLNSIELKDMSKYGALFALVDINNVKINTIQRALLDKGILSIDDLQKAYEKYSNFEKDSQEFINKLKKGV